MVTVSAAERLDHAIADDEFECHCVIGLKPLYGWRGETRCEIDAVASDKVTLGTAHLRPKHR